jgi:flagellar hook-associated protein 3 FlgL
MTTSNVSTLGQLLENNARLNDVRRQLNTLQLQLSSGKKTDVFSGLGDQGSRSLRVRVEINQIDVFQSNIDIGRTRLRETVQTLEDFSTQAKNFADSMAFAQQQGNIDIQSLREGARAAMVYLRDLLNSRDGDRFILAGADSFVAPIDAGAAHDTYLSGQIEAWRTGTLTTATLKTNYTGTPETTMGYSAALSSNLVRNNFIRADVNTEVDYTLTGDQEGFKRILNAIGMMANMDLDKVALDDGDNPALVKTAPGATRTEQKEEFFSLFEHMIKEINGGINNLRTENQRLERADVVLGSIRADHIIDRNTLETTLGQIEDADPAEVAVKINALQTQLEASYQVTALLGSLSLSRFIG